MTSPSGSRAAGVPGSGDDSEQTPASAAGRTDARAAVTTSENGAAAGAPASAKPDPGAPAATPSCAAEAGTDVSDGALAQPATEAGPDQQADQADQADQAVGGPAGYQPGPVWARWLPPVAAFVIALWRITVPSYWRDEAATLAVVRRPLGDLITMLGNVDAVHSAYYLMMWPVEDVLGSSPIMMRAPSAFAVAVGAGAVAATGRRLISPWAGLAAGLVFAILPEVSRYGQEARSYAMVTAAAAIASYVLVRVLGAEPEHRRRWLVGYSASIAVLGILNIFGVLLLPAHALTVPLYCRRSWRDRAVQRLALGWAAAVVGGVVIASPLLVLGWQQRGQIAWLSVNTSTSGLNTLFSLSGSYLVTTAVLAVIAVALMLTT